MNTETITLIIVTVLGIVYGAVKHGIHLYISEATKKVLGALIHKPFKGEDINQEFTSIYERMVEIKTSLDADRITLDRFHNGSSFLANQPAWKISRVYEICSAGISYELNIMQNVLAMSIWDTVSALFDTTMKKYCDKLVGRICNDAGCKKPFGVYRYNINKMPESYGKVILRNQGVQTLIQIPLIHKEQIVGFLGVHFVDENLEDFDTCSICQKVQEIAYFLNKE